MNTITQIENALKAINQAKFQALINHLLYLQGNQFIGAPGAVVGKEKTSKGTPDSYFVNNGKYIFVECTTQEKLGGLKSFIDKLTKDLYHCFDEEKTTIKTDRIEKVILACCEKISIEEYNLLSTKTKSYNSNTELEILNIQNLPLLIFELPKLAEEYLNVQIIKGDIFPLREFLAKTTKGLQPSLTNEFIGREEELKRSIEILKKCDILLLSGGAGVGKSKLAVKILEELSKEDYMPIVIQSSGVSLWEDYQHLFLPGKIHIILFDDANKSITNLNYLLTKIGASQAYTAKVIITSRDYVKKQVSTALDNYPYEELSIKEFKDEEIGRIIVAALPNLKYHNDIRRTIIEIAKGNARVALMATYSVTPGSETNYLNSPVLLYEKYFKKISDELGIFENPIILKSLAIVSFFGVLDRNNEELRTMLKANFEIDWNELWTAILELHNHEILDVYANEIVKVSDQVLATYAFYKCFIDSKSALINYATWIPNFVDKYSNRIRITLVDANNTFAYNHIKKLVLPHLNVVVKLTTTHDTLYAFYKIFWFYKGRDCLLYLKTYIEKLPQEMHSDPVKFTFVHNDHTSPSKYFELLKEFWSHPNELLNPSLELTFNLLTKQPARLPEILKFIHDDFKYKLEDTDHEYLRQNILLDFLIDAHLSEVQKSFANGFFLSIAKPLLGWHFTDFGPAKGHALTITNFDLAKSDALISLRKRILNQVYHLFEAGNEQSNKLLQKIINPGGAIDKSIYLEELPIYRKLIYDKLDNNQFTHCKFVRELSKYLAETGAAIPENWNEFIESDVIKLSKFLKADWEFREGKSTEESENEKREEFDVFVTENNWQTIEKMLLNINALYIQRADDNAWFIENAVNDIYISIARKGKSELECALRLFFNGQVNFRLQATVIKFALLEHILTGEQVLDIIEEYEFEAKPYWLSVLFAMLPDEQVNSSFLIQLINTFQNSANYIYIHRMLDYIKYQKVFNEFKKSDPQLASHNIITYLTSIILPKPRKSPIDFGFNFCADCASYFVEHLNLLKDAYWAQFGGHANFDHDGKELKAILDLDKSFITEGFKNGRIGLGYPSQIRLEKIHTDWLWESDEYEELIEDLLLTALKKKKYIYIPEKGISSLFKLKNASEEKTEKAKALILSLTKKHVANEKIVLALVEAAFYNFINWFPEYFRELLFLNREIALIRQISFSRSQSWSGSRVPVIQKDIEFYQNILEVINTLPNILDYSQHIDFFEQKIEREKMNIEREQKRDFIDEYN